VPDTITAALLVEISGEPMHPDDEDRFARRYPNGVHFEVSELLDVVLEFPDHASLEEIAQHLLPPSAYWSHVQPITYHVERLEASSRGLFRDTLHHPKAASLMVELLGVARPHVNREIAEVLEREIPRLQAAQLRDEVSEAMAEAVAS
jgi:hypothetical protein